MHDYGGYGFIAQSARALAWRGHEVLHLHNSSLRSGKGRLERTADDPATLAFGGIAIDPALDRYKVADRVRMERAYARALVRAAREWTPDVVMSANTPLLVMSSFGRALRHDSVPLVNWLQDIHSVAMGAALATRLGWAGGLGGALLRRMEGRLLRTCSAVVPITSDFLPLLREWRVPMETVTVVPNWAELIATTERRNPFSTEHGLNDVTTLLYAGTLGLKHDAQQLILLAETFAGRDDVRVVVVSEGLGRSWLEQNGHRGLGTLVLLDFQPHERLPDVLGSADVLLSMLRSEAGTFSVPSKILTYLAAGRAQLAAVPAENLAARTLLESGGGLLVEPGLADDWVVAARRLVDDPQLREVLGARGRSYAEEHFVVESKAAALEKVLLAAIEGQR